MEKNSSARLFKGVRGHFLWTLLMGIGVAINFFPLPILNAKFIFGSIFAMLILRLFGLSRAVFAGALIASVTFFQWNHPWALVTMSAEVAVAGWLIRRRPLNLVTAVSLYWLVIGLPLGFFCYSLIGGYSAETTFFLLSKQAFNGVFNALVANLGVVLLALFLPKRIKVSFQELLSNLLLFFVLATAMLLLVAGGQNDLADADRQLRSLIIQENRFLTWKLVDWLEERKHQLSHLGESAVSLLDWEGNMPDFSRPAQKVLQDIMTPSALAVLRDRREVTLWTHAINRNGRDEPLVLMVSPLLIDGSNRDDLCPLSPFSFPAGKLKALDIGISQWLPKLPSNTSNIEIWGSSSGSWLWP